MVPMWVHAFPNEWSSVGHEQGVLWIIEAVHSI